ncbi:MAG: alanine--tRNA ligase-related protein, partial [Patescibacteria group bacterium]
VAQNKKNIFETDLFPKLTALLLVGDEETIRSGRIVLDHLRATVFLLSDGVRPSNKEQGSILRRLIRRLMIHSNLSEIKENLLLLSEARLVNFVGEVIGLYSGFYKLDKDAIVNELKKELQVFGLTLKSGLRQFNKRYPGMRTHMLVPGQPIEPFIIGQEVGKDAADLYQTFGFPVEVIRELLEKRLYKFDQKEFEKTLKQETEKHKEISRAGQEKKFGGHGLILDTGELKAGSEEELKKVTRLHTATHLLQAALREVLGFDVKQMGSDITPERTRFDFSFGRKLTPEELKKIETLVNDMIKADLGVKMKEMDYEEAVSSGALSFFRHKYPKMVKVYSIGEGDNVVSREFCGGPHVSDTGEIGKFVITKEEAISSGVRRIRASIKP